jgi:hypothetical protein
MAGARRLQGALRTALGPILKETGPSVGVLSQRWREMVGERLADVTQPLRLEPTKKGAILHIRAPSAASAVLQHASGHILQRVSLAAGVEVRELRIVQTSADAPRAKAPRLKELPEADRRAIAAAAAGIATHDLRQALIALGEAIARAETGRT